MNYEISRNEIENVKNDLSIPFINSYLQVIYARELIKMSEKQVETTALQIVKLRSLVDIGLRTEADFLQLKAQLAMDNKSLVKAKARLKSAKIVLKNQMSLSLSDSFDILYTLIPEIEPPFPEHTPGIYTSVILSQAIIEYYRSKTQTAAYSLKTSKDGLYPALSSRAAVNSFCSSAGGYTGISYKWLLKNNGFFQYETYEMVTGFVTSPVYNLSDYPFWNQIRDFRKVSLSLSLPLFNSYQVYYAFQKQNNTYTQALRNEQNLINDLRKTIEQASKDVENAVAAYHTSRQQLEVSLGIYEKSSGKFAKALIHVSDFLIDKNKYHIAQFQYLQAKYDLISRMKILDYYRGMPFDL